MVSLDIRCANGASWLDENIPDWHNRMYIPSLEMGFCDQCIFGQLFGLYHRGLTKMCMSGETAVRLGLCRDTTDCDTNESWTQMWVDLITKRRQHDYANVC
jgi:hypothetical protein